MMRFSAWKRSVQPAASVLSVGLAVSTAALTGCGGAKDAGSANKSSDSDVTGSGASGGANGGSKSSGSSGDMYAAPAGCSQTVCDANETQCLNESSSQCRQCEDICAEGTDPDCFEECSDICDNPTSTTLCEKVASDCRQSSTNTQCADAPATTGTSSTPTGADAGASTATTADADAGPSCTPVAPTNLSWPGAATQLPQSCNAEELQTIAIACADDQQATACRDAISRASTLCRSCVLPPATANDGPILTDANGFTYMNQAGCIDIVKPTCGNQWGPVIACEIDACSCGDQRCINHAAIVCDTTVLTSYCETSDILDGACFQEPGQTAKDFTLAILSTFCQ